MKLRGLGLLGALGACACAAHGARAADLLQIYERALGSDPLWQQAIQTRLAAREVKTQAIINLLPLDLSADKSFQAVGGQDIRTPTYGGLNLSINLFSWSSWVALKAADATVAQAEANYQAAAQNLVQRVATQYFAVLGAQDTLTAEQSALTSVQRQLDQAQQRYDEGLIAITDVLTARAERDSTAAAVIADKRTLATQEDLLLAITEQTYASLAAPRDDMPLLTPQPATEQDWVQTAMNQNAALVASRLNADIAHDNLLAAYGGHAPTISIGVARDVALEHGQFATLQQFFGYDAPGLVPPPNTSSLIWQALISVPIFTGGEVSSKVRQARYSWLAAKDGLEYNSRQTEEQTRDAYQGVVSQIAQVRALRQAVQSNRVALESTEAGYSVGARNVVDVLTARELLVQAETNYAQARYAYLDDIVALRLAAGTLDRRTIEQINGWLEPGPPQPGVPAVPGGDSSTPVAPLSAPLVLPPPVPAAGAQAPDPGASAAGQPALLPVPGASGAAPLPPRP